MKKPLKITPLEPAVTAGGYIVEGEQLLTRHEWNAGIRPTDAELAKRRKAIQGDPVTLATIAISAPPHPALEQPTDWLGAEATKPVDHAQIVELKAAAPLRKPVEQHDVDGLDLFDVARQPNLL
jgi:hypothetical protein